MPQLPLARRMLLLELAPHLRSEELAKSRAAEILRAPNSADTDGLRLLFVARVPVSRLQFAD